LPKAEPSAPEPSSRHAGSAGPDRQGPAAGPLRRGALAGTVFVVAFLLNWCWEAAQVPAYAGSEDMPWAPRLLHCLPATILDALFVAGLYCAGAVLLQDRNWIRHLGGRGYLAVALAGAGAAVLVERLAIGFGWWDYNAAMPRVPVLGVGLSPVAQLAVTPVISFLLAGRLARSSRDQERGT